MFVVQLHVYRSIRCTQPLSGMLKIRFEAVLFGFNVLLYQATK